MELEDLSVKNLVDEYLVKKALADNSRDNSHFHPSEFFGCKRKIAYKYYLYKDIIQISGLTFDPIGQRIFSNGHFVHFRWGSYLQDKDCAATMLLGRWKCKNKYAHEYAWKVNPQLNRESCKPSIFGLDKELGTIRPTKPCSCGCDDFEYVEIGFFDEETWLGGHVDGILLFPSGDYVVIDYKSARKRVFDKIEDEPKPEHYIQMQCYLYLSKLKYGKFIYECKDDQDVKEINVIRNDDVIQSIVEDAVLLKKVVTTVKSNGNRALPPRTNSFNPERDKKIGRTVIEYNKGMYECVSNCPFRKYCFG